MIKEKEISGFDADLSNSKNNYPQSQNPNAFKLYFNMLSIASRGGSKTHTLTRIIKDYELNKLIDDDGVVHPLRTFLISPTISANKVFKNLKSIDENDMYEEYSDDILKGIIDEIEKTKEEVMKFKLYKEAYKLVERTPKKKIGELLMRRPELTEILEQYEYQHPDKIDIKYKEIPINFCVLDDLMGSSAFNKSSQSLLTYHLIRNRHLGISFFILVQSAKSVPKAIRQNCNVFFLGKFASKRHILDDMYEEVSNVLTEEQFIELYDYAISEKYGALIIDNSGDTKRFYKSLDTELLIE